MDYWPNVDAVSWFSSDILPGLTDAFPAVRFYIVGMRPTGAVRMLAGAHVTVTGTVPDVRPYLAHARLVVAPLRIARGVQNKVLEAMAMGRPVLASAACAGGIDAKQGVDIEVAADARDFVARARALLGDPAHGEALGRQARACVLSRYSWEARLARIDAYLEAAGCRGDSAAPVPGSAPGRSRCTTGMAA
jgi:glycosyltransferase involved in cell wall biosynthesis